MVGNGPSCLESRNGSFIDSCDMVIRIGHCVIKGYEEYVGSKLTIYAGRWRKIEGHWDLCKTADKIWVLYPKPPHYWNSNHLGPHSVTRNDLSLHRMKVDESKIVYVPDEIQETYKTRYKGSLPKRSDQVCGFNIPASGDVIIDMALHFYPDSKIYVTGFDGYFTDTTYYFDRNRQIGKDFRCDSPVLQQQIRFRKLVARGDIQVL